MHTRAALFVLALIFVGCGDDTGSEDAPPARDAGRRDAKASDDTDAEDVDDDDEAPIEDAATRRDASVRDAGRDAQAADDASTRDAAVPQDAGGGETSMGETGRMVGMTAAHNAVRAKVETTMSLPPMKWSSTLAAYAQEWADHLAQTQCNNPQHRSGTELQAKKYGENLAYYATVGGGKLTDSAQTAVDSWAGEVACYTYGPFMRGDACDATCYKAMNSDGCGHYTAIVWRTTTEVGCGVATCSAAGRTSDIWICNYSPGGNFIGQKPY